MTDLPRDSLLKDHDILLLDFLGFSAAVETWDDSKLERLINVVVGIAAAQSEFDVIGEIQDDGGYKVSSPPEITTFSDHMVVSYPCIAKPAEIPEEMWPVLSALWEDMVRHQMQKIAAQMAMAALDVGLLIRGGLSRGKLYHHKSVVIGEAMLDAHRLESKIARDARVAVSERILDDDRIFKDDDGVRCLDYFTEMMLLADDRYGDGKAWADARMVDIVATIQILNDGGCFKEAAKWVNFRGKFQHLIDTWA